MTNKNWEIEEPKEYLCTKSCYFIEGKKYFRVTQILGVISKPALIYWYGKYGMKKCRQILHLRAEFGTTVHKLFEIIMGGDEVTSDNYNDEIQTTIKLFNEWRSEHKFKDVATEQHLWSKKHKYAGTTDCIAIMDNELVLLDWKTSKDIYDEYWLQLSMYVAAFEELTGVKIDKCGIVQIRDGKSKYETKTYDEIMEYFEASKAAIVLFEWRNRK